MTPERWKQVNELFHAALTRAPAERPSLLDQACIGDPELRYEVESLIKSYVETGSFIDVHAFDAGAQLLAKRSDLAPGHVGPNRNRSIWKMPSQGGDAMQVTRQGGS